MLMWKGGYLPGIKSFWSPEKGGIFGQGPDPRHQEKDLPNVCAVSLGVWSRALDSSQKTS